MRAALLGCGAHGAGTLLPAARAAGIEPVALVDQELGRAQEAAHRWGVAAVHESIEDVSDVEAVIIALPVDQHAAHVSRALRRGWHVFVEKSPAVDPAQLRAVVEQVEASGLVCRVGMNFRCAEGVRALSSRLSTGRHGDVIYTRVVQIGRKPIAPLGEGLSLLASLFHAQGIHAIDLALTLAGSVQVTNSQLLGANRGAFFVLAGEDHTGRRRFEVACGSCSAGLYHQLDVLTSTGDLLSLRNLSELVYMPHGGADDVDEYPGARVLWRRSPLSIGYAAAGYAIELSAFRTLVRGGAGEQAIRLASPGDLVPVYDAFDQLLVSEGLTWTP